MKKHLTLRNGLIMLVGILLVGAVVLYFARGWVRNDALPFAVQHTIANGYETKAKEELAKLGQPFQILGFKEVEQAGQCFRTYALKFHTVITCNYTATAGQEVPLGSDKSKELVSNATKLQAALNANGWKGEYNDDSEITSLHKFAAALQRGDDFTPDASYLKQIEPGLNCSLSSITAFKKPNQPYMLTNFYCDKQQAIF